MDILCLALATIPRTVYPSTHILPFPEYVANSESEDDIDITDSAGFQALSPPLASITYADILTEKSLDALRQKLSVDVKRLSPLLSVLIPPPGY